MAVASGTGSLTVTGGAWGPLTAVDSASACQREREREEFDRDSISRSD